MTKIGFVGAGKIGSNAVYATLHRVEVDEIAIVDIVEDLAVGEAMDLNTSAAGLGLRTRVVGGSDYSLLTGSDLVVVTAGLPRKPGMTRADLLAKNVGIMKTIVAGIKENAPDTNILVVSNPVDALTYVAYKESGFEKNRVFGMGALHDTIRLRENLRDQGATVYDAWTLGPHGEKMFPATAIARVEGITPDWDAVKEAVRGRAMSIIERKGATYYAPGIAISTMIKAVIDDEKRVLPTVSVLEGEYGLSDMTIGVPAILGATGVDRVLEYELSDKDRAWFEEGIKAVQSQISEAGY